jgi:NhaA family Na+:H+ antiporter
MPRALRQFLATEASSGLFLLAATAFALAWANSPWSDSYGRLWEAHIVLGVGDWSIAEDLRHWVNDGLMAIFFFVAGVEIKRELVEGDLRDPRAAALPVLAALGGMAVPAVLFAVVNVGAAGSRGWGVPMATDIAFAVGVVVLLGARVHPGLKLFLLTLAIADDIGAIVVIALFYAQSVDFGALAVSGLALASIVGMRRLGVTSLAAFGALAVVAWLAMYESGVHATIAGVLVGLLTPARPIAPMAMVKEWAADLDEEPSVEQLAAVEKLARHAISPAERLQHLLHPFSSFVIIPVFALANAGVAIDRGMLDAPGATTVALGVVLGLVVGKTVGISLAAWLAVRLRLGRLPAGVTWRQLVGVAALGGIGFTVALFVAGLAFADPALADAAKVGILAGSALAAVVGSLLMLTSSRSTAD